MFWEFSQAISESLEVYRHVDTEEVIILIHTKYKNHNLYFLDTQVTKS